MLVVLYRFALVLGRGRDEVVVFLSLVLYIHLLSITAHKDSDDELPFEVNVQDQLLYFLAVPKHDQLILPVRHGIVKAAADRSCVRVAHSGQHHPLIELVKDDLTVRL